MTIFNTNKLDTIKRNIDKELNKGDQGGVIREIYNGLNILTDEIKELKKENKRLKKQLNKLTGEQQ